MRLAQHDGFGLVKLRHRDGMFQAHCLIEVIERLVRHTLGGLQVGEVGKDPGKVRKATDVDPR